MFFKISATNIRELRRKAKPPLRFLAVWQKCRMTGAILGQILCSSNNTMQAGKSCAAWRVILNGYVCVEDELLYI